MKTNITVLLLTFIGSGCAIQPTVTKTADGQQAYTFTCSAGTEQCEQASTTWCPTGYDVIEHGQQASPVVPHYGEYPVTLLTDSLTVQCK